MDLTKKESILIYIATRRYTCKYNNNNFCICLKNLIVLHVLVLFVFLSVYRFRHHPFIMGATDIYAWEQPFIKNRTRPSKRHLYATYVYSRQHGIVIYLYKCILYTSASDVIARYTPRSVVVNKIAVTPLTHVVYIIHNIYITSMAP